MSDRPKGHFDIIRYITVQSLHDDSLNLVAVVCANHAFTAVGAKISPYHARASLLPKPMLAELQARPATSSSSVKRYTVVYVPVVS